MPGGQGIYDNTDEPDEGEGSTQTAGDDVDTDTDTPDVITPEGAEPTD
jgi:hypothetical protein